jgi:hypothetical protein
MTRKLRMYVATLMVLGTIGVGARSAHAADPQVPFGGFYSGTATSTSSTTLTLNGTGTATHLGFGANVGYVALVGQDNSCTGGLDAVNNETLTAANGDTLTLTINDVSCETSLTSNVYNGTGTYVVNGGTGQFSGATGQGSFDGHADFNQGLFRFQLAGTISAPSRS